MRSAHLDPSWITTDAAALCGDDFGCVTHVVNDADVAGLAEVGFGAEADGPLLRGDEIDWAWRILDPVLDEWATGQPGLYPSGSSGPGQQERHPATATGSRLANHRSVMLEMTRQSRETSAICSRPGRPVNSG